MNSNFPHAVGVIRAALESTGADRATAVAHALDTARLLVDPGRTFGVVLHRTPDGGWSPAPRPLTDLERKALAWDAACARARSVAHAIERRLAGHTGPSGVRVDGDRVRVVLRVDGPLLWARWRAYLGITAVAAGARPHTVVGEGERDGVRVTVLAHGPTSTPPTSGSALAGSASVGAGSVGSASVESDSVRATSAESGPVGAASVGPGPVAPDFAGCASVESGSAGSGTQVSAPATSRLAASPSAAPLSGPSPASPSPASSSSASSFAVSPSAVPQLAAQAPGATPSAVLPSAVPPLAVLPLGASPVGTPPTGAPVSSSPRPPTRLFRFGGVTYDLAFPQRDAHGDLWYFQGCRSHDAMPLLSLDGRPERCSLANVAIHLGPLTPVRAGAADVVAADARALPPPVRPPGEPSGPVCGPIGPAV